MIADSGLHVWLDTQVNPGQTTLIPYVRSVKDMQINFRLDVVQRGSAGTSRITQQGLVKAAAESPTSLGRVAVGVQKGAECSIELVLKENGTDLGVYHFECPQ